MGLLEDRLHEYASTGAEAAPLRACTGLVEVISLSQFDDETHDGVQFAPRCLACLPADERRYCAHSPPLNYCIPSPRNSCAIS